MFQKAFVVAVVLLGAALMAVPAEAILFNLTSDHCTGGCGTAPFGTVDVTQVGANVHIVVDLANGPPNAVGWAQTGAGAPMACPPPPVRGEWRRWQSSSRKCLKSTCLCHAELLATLAAKVASDKFGSVS